MDVAGWLPPRHRVAGQPHANPAVAEATCAERDSLGGRGLVGPRQLERPHRPKSWSEEGLAGKRWRQPYPQRGRG